MTVCVSVAVVRGRGWEGRGLEVFTGYLFATSEWNKRVLKQIGKK